MSLHHNLTGVTKFMADLIPIITRDTELKMEERYQIIKHCQDLKPATRRLVWKALMEYQGLPVGNQMQCLMDIAETLREEWTQPNVITAFSVFYETHKGSLTVLTMLKQALGELELKRLLP